MGVSFETKYEREFTELQKDETGGLPKEKFEKLYKNNKPSIRYFLYRAYGLMKKANEAFAVSSCVSKATKDKSKKICSEVRECLINMLVECDEMERFFDTVKTYGDMLKSNVGFVKIRTENDFRSVCNDHSVFFTTDMNKAWSFWERKQSLEHFKDTCYNSKEMLNFFKELEQSSSDTEVKKHAKRLYETIEEQLRFFKVCYGETYLDNAKTFVTFNNKGE